MCVCYSSGGSSVYKERYMEGKLSAFKGLVVGWRRGVVAPAAGDWVAMTVGPAFWRNIAWWLDHVQHRSLAPFDRDSVSAGGVLAGTDASGCLL